MLASSLTLKPNIYRFGFAVAAGDKQGEPVKERCFMGLCKK